MTIRTNARLAGFMFLFYIATAATDMVLFDRARGSGDPATQLANLAHHTDVVGVSAILTFLAFVDALVLGVALYGLTRHTDHELALLALGCRVAEGVINGVGAIERQALRTVVTMSGSGGPDAATASSFGTMLLRYDDWSVNVGAACFAVGSTIFAYLLLRGRTIPAWLAWVGVIGSLFLVVGLPMRIGGFLRGPINDLMWIPVGVFEVVGGIWLLVKGAPERPQLAPAGGV